MNKIIVNALSHPLIKNHKIGDLYYMDNKPEPWKIAYFPIFEDNKTKEVYPEPRALVEKPIQDGIDFREVPLRYLTKITKDVYPTYTMEITIKIEERKLTTEAELKTFPSAIDNVLYIEEKIFNIK